MKPIKQWTDSEYQVLVGTLIVVMVIFGMFMFGRYYPTGTVLKQTLPEAISWTGENLQNAFDSNPDTAWIGKEGKYTDYNYVTIDLKEKTELESVSLLLGGDGQPVNYLLSIGGSQDNNRWTDVIGALETGSFTDNLLYTIPLYPNFNYRYLKVGLKTYGVVQKFRVYDITFIPKKNEEK